VQELVACKLELAESKEANLKVQRELTRAQETVTRSASMRASGA
jgi:hypothetical protein